MFIFSFQFFVTNRRSALGAQWSFHSSPLLGATCFVFCVSSHKSRPAVGIVGHRLFRAAPLSERGVQPRRGALRAAPRTEQSLSRHALWVVPRPCPRRPLADDVPVDSSSTATNKQRAQQNSANPHESKPSPRPVGKGSFAKTRRTFQNKAGQRHFRAPELARCEAGQSNSEASAERQTSSSINKLRNRSESRRKSFVL